VLAVPVVAGAADRRGALHQALVLAALASTAGSIAIGFADGFLAIFAVSAVLACSYTPMMPITDAYALKALRERARAYGPVRLWGSVAFVVAGIVAGLFLDFVPARHLIWLMAAVFATTALVGLTLPPLSPAPASNVPPPRGATLLRDKTFVAVIVAAGLIQSSHGFYYGFGGLDWRAAGLRGFVIANLWSVGVVAEIILFAFSPRLPQPIGPTMLLLIGAAGGILRWSVMAMDPPLALLPLLQALHGLTFGATHLGAVGFIARAAHDRLGATAQGYLSTVIGLTMAASVGLSGELYGTAGRTGYAVMAVIAFAGGAVALLAHRFNRQS
jgi:PPP family 3-phenylpropionic acid transporter